jgi:hypothetical protein
LSSFWLTLKQQWPIKISSPLFSIFSLAAILVGSRDHRTQFWKGAIQGPFHQSLVAIGPVVSEEKIKMWNVDGRTMDEVMTIKIQEIALNVQSVKSGMLRKSLQHHSSKQSMQSIRNINSWHFEIFQTLNQD